jgi:hypothetical protein
MSSCRTERRFFFAILHPPSSILVFLFASLSSILVLSTAAGCNVAALAVQRLSPPPMVYAKYEPKREPMLVLVENFDNPSANHVGAQQLTAQLTQDLTAHKVAPLVDAGVLHTLRDADPVAYGKMSIPQLGRAAGATQVLYLNLQQMRLNNDGIMAQASASGRVKIVDVATGESRWPSDLPEGYVVAMQTPYVRLDDRVTAPALTAQMIRGLSDQVAKLFYKYRMEEGVQ